MSVDLDAAARRALAFGLMQDRIKTADALNRQDMQQNMAVTDRKAVMGLSNGEPILLGSVTYAKGAAATTSASVVDADALLGWVQANRPDAVVHTVTVAPWFTAELLKVSKDRGAAVDDFGELIPGIEVSEGTAGKPHLMVKREKSDEATAALIDMLFEHGVAGVRSLLAIEPSPEEDA